MNTTQQPTTNAEQSQVGNLTRRGKLVRAAAILAAGATLVGGAAKLHESGTDTNRNFLKERIATTGAPGFGTFVAEAGAPILDAPSARTEGLEGSEDNSYDAMPVVPEGTTITFNSPVLVEGNDGSPTERPTLYAVMMPFHEGDEGTIAIPHTLDELSADAKVIPFADLVYASEDDGAYNIGQHGQTQTMLDQLPADYEVVSHDKQ